MAERERDDQRVRAADGRTSRRQEIAEKRGGYRGSRVTSIPKRPEGPAPDHNAPADGNRDPAGARKPSSATDASSSSEGPDGSD